jgi:hypothetical protein
MAEEVKTKREAWTPDPNSGYGRHSYHHIDPSTVNPEDYARNLRGEEKHYGDVREYNTCYNEKHPDNTLDLYDLGLLLTRFTTEAPGYEGEWTVVDFPRVKAPGIWTRVRKTGEDGQPEGETLEIPIVALGIAANDKNEYEPIVSKLVKRGATDREQRMRLKTGRATRDRLQEKVQGGSAGERSHGTPAEGIGAVAVDQG